MSFMHVLIIPNFFLASFPYFLTFILFMLWVLTNSNAAADIQHRFILLLEFLERLQCWSLIRPCSAFDKLGRGKSCSNADMLIAKLRAYTSHISYGFLVVLNTLV